jgi:succinate dehydrogenase/fumarate reductase flavoprotein subunit
MSDQCSAIAPVALASISEWHDECDVLVMGLGAAGASAALEARAEGADVLVLEVAGEGGGSTALAGGLIYFGGGTPVQKACGVEDSLDDMERYLQKAVGPNGDDARVKEYVSNNLAHYDWLLQQGMVFKHEMATYKATNTQGDEGLIITGNEACYPFDEIARPAPRGHKGQAHGEGGGAMLMQVLINACEKEGVRFSYETRVLSAIVDETGRACGLIARINGQEKAIRARNGVVLCAGGFIMNREMVKHYAPRLAKANVPLGNPNDTGIGIRLGQGLGAAVTNMDDGFISIPFYPPGEFVEGIVVNSQGKRVIAEDCYHGRMASLMFDNPDEKYYLIIDSRHFSALEKPPLGGMQVKEVGETIEELERDLGLPENSLVSTLARFNEHAIQGEDPDFHKRKPYLIALDQPGYAALDFSMGGGAWFPAFTFGGLTTAISGEVLDAEGSAIAGLYAAGRTTAGLPRSGEFYSSGMSIGDATYFGRLAGRSAAQHVSI